MVAVSTMKNFEHRLLPLWINPCNFWNSFGKPLLSSGFAKLQFIDIFFSLGDKARYLTCKGHTQKAVSDSSCFSNFLWGLTGCLQTENPLKNLWILVQSSEKIWWPKTSEKPLIFCYGVMKWFKSTKNISFKVIFIGKIQKFRACDALFLVLDDIEHFLAAFGQY